MKVVFLGSGNLATRLSLEMKRKGFDIRQVYSHTPVHAEQLANRLQCNWTYLPGKVEIDADLYIFALKDTVLEPLIARIAPNGGLWVHTAGSMPMDVFKGHTARYGVLYPMQTFSKERAVDFRAIPFFLEANNEADTELLRDVAGQLSDHVRILSSESRKYLHLAAVFACNFTNHLYALAAKLLQEQGIPSEVLLPLIDETASKVHAMPAQEAQTGPAIRYDENVINKHLALLEAHPEMQTIYQLMSQSIHKEAQS